MMNHFWFIVPTQQRNTRKKYPVLRYEHACDTHSLSVFEKVEQASFVHRVKTQNSLLPNKLALWLSVWERNKRTFAFFLTQKGGTAK